MTALTFYTPCAGGLPSSHGYRTESANQFFSKKISKKFRSVTFHVHIKISMENALMNTNKQAYVWFSSS